MSISLEDNVGDIIGKAQRGLRLNASIPTDEAGLRKLAEKLRLGPDALAAIAKGAWRPEERNLTGLAYFNTPFDDMTVNSYLVWDPKSRQTAAFDTGTDASDMIQFARDQQLTIALILITHTHTDHVLDLDRLVRATGAPAFVCEREPISGVEPFAAGKVFPLGDLRIETRQTTGHSRGGITYVVRGLERPVAVVGDAMFAGSMGGGLVSYEDALRTNREQIFTLPDETILCCGHGPLTTVGEEKLHNPFFPEFQRGS